MKPSKIISGGQTGADRAGLDWARGAGLPTGGWVPLGGRAEDGRVVDSYPELRETSTADPAERTERNIREADASVIFLGADSPGTELALRLARSLGKPYLTVPGASISGARRWTKRLPQRYVLNIAGPRASEDELAYRRAYDFLDELFSSQQKESRAAQR